jgi:haloalkane dehalogenase
MTVAERPAWVDDELFPFESRFVDIDGHSVHYVDEGSGPTLLFLHGNPTWSFV